MEMLERLLKDTARRLAGAHAPVTRIEWCVSQWSSMGCDRQRWIVGRTVEVPWRVFGDQRDTRERRQVDGMKMRYTLIHAHETHMAFAAKHL